MDTRFTEFLGFHPDGDEWKVMGMSAYGDPSRYRKQFARLFGLNRAGGYELDLNYFDHYNFDVSSMLSPKFVDLFGPPRAPASEIEQHHYDVAAAAQEALEEIVFHCLIELHERTGSRNLCLSGGTIMNSVCNGKVIDNTPFDRVYIPFSPDDTGNAIGAALLLYFQLLKNPRVDTGITHPFVGPEYSSGDIEDTLRRYGLSYRRSDSVIRETALSIADGKVIGWFQGRMEFGQRALGNRSILADPRDEGMKDRLNAAVKYRERFRPFAPSILAEDVEEYFDLEPDGTVPFMERVCKIREEKRSLIPAVVHDDGTGRVQTVERRQNPRFYDLLTEFKRVTGIPLLVNTSFNVKGEPIVCSPTDAIRTFYTSGLDQLVMDDFVVEKS